MLEVNNFTAIANKITPKILRITLIPCLPNTLSIFPEDFKTIYTNNLIDAYMLFKEDSVIGGENALQQYKEILREYVHLARKDVPVIQTESEYFKNLTFMFSIAVMYLKDLEEAKQ